MNVAVYMQFPWLQFICCRSTFPSCIVGDCICIRLTLPGNCACVQVPCLHVLMFHESKFPVVPCWKFLFDSPSGTPFTGLVRGICISYPVVWLISINVAWYLAAALGGCCCKLNVALPEHHGSITSLAATRFSHGRFSIPLAFCPSVSVKPGVGRLKLNGLASCDVAHIPGVVHAFSCHLYSFSVGSAPGIEGSRVVTVVLNVFSPVCFAFDWIELAFACAMFAGWLFESRNCSWAV